MMSDQNQTTELQGAASIIDRLLCLLPDHDYNAVDHALLWLLEHDRLGLRLSIATRDKMETLRARATS